MANPLSSMNNLQQRVLVAVAGIGFFLGMLYWGWEGAMILFLLILGLSLFEFYSLSPFPLSSTWKWLGTGLGVLIFLLLVFMQISPNLRIARLLFLVPPLLFCALVFAGPSRPFERTGWLVLGWFYLITPWLSMVLIILDFQYEPALVLGLFGLLWMADSGAYFAGRKFGRFKLFPRVSPKKTWEGLAGGLGASLALAWFLGNYLGYFTPSQWLILAVSTTLTGTLGDLAESVLKRSLDLKDSGSLLPGHGGILDRFDGLVIAAPVNLILITFIF